MLISLHTLGNTSHGSRLKHKNVAYLNRIACSNVKKAKVLCLLIAGDSKLSRHFYIYSCLQVKLELCFDIITVTF